MQQRRLVLHAGEVLFDVRKDPTRPFVVHAAGGSATALGTVYAVRHVRSGAEVDVVEGQVAVRPAASASPRLLTADRRVGYEEGRFLGSVQTVDASAATAWQRGKLIFNRRPLGSVIATLQRYRYGRILLADDTLEAIPVTGVFDLTDEAATFDLLEATLPVEIVRLPLLTVVRHKPAR